MVKITDEMIDQAREAIHQHYKLFGNPPSYLPCPLVMKTALHAALNPPVRCKNCGKPTSEHDVVSQQMGNRTYEGLVVCRGYVWEPVEVFLSGQYDAKNG